MDDLGDPGSSQTTPPRAAADDNHLGSSGRRHRHDHAHGGRAGESSSPGRPMGRARQRHSPVRVMRHSSGHVTNIHRIDVINNFGGAADGGGWTRMARIRRGRTGAGARDARRAWCAVQAGLAVAVTLWLGTAATVVRRSYDEASGGGRWALGRTVPAPRSTAQQEERPALRKASGERVAGQQPAAARSAAGRPAAAAPSPAVADGGTPHSIFELSLFGNESPSDFQLYTPHAPSCAAPLRGDDVSYTLVSQLSEDRLWMVPHHCERWGDSPMSLVIFSDRTADDVVSELVSHGCSDEYVTVQTVSPTLYDPTGTEYPVNVLRNIAMAAVRTTHVVYADVDFWPSTDLRSTLDRPAVRDRFASDPWLATVVPVFQMSRRCRESKDCRELNIPVMPKRKSALLNLIRKRQASTFDPTNAGGHGSTKYITWKDQEPGTFVDLPCIKSNRYEPYLVFRYCSDLPPFQEGFTGYGKNKMTWVMQLRRAGYLFSQLGGAFLVHYPHLTSKARQEWDKKPARLGRRGKKPGDLDQKEREAINWGFFKRARVDALFLEFKEWLDGTVEDESRVPMCRDALNDDTRLWVQQGAEDEDNDDDEFEEEIEEENTDDGEYFVEYNDYLDAKEAYEPCREGSPRDASAECEKPMVDFIESAMLWSLVGFEAEYLGPTTQMEYLVEAEECAKRLMELHPLPGENDGGGDYSFSKLVADLYTNMGVVAKNSHSESTARTYIDKALALHPNDTYALTILKQLRTENSLEPSEDTKEEVAVQSPDNSEIVNGEGVEEE